MMKGITLMLAAISALMVEALAEGDCKEEANSTLREIDCVVKKLNWMINVTEDLLLRTRVHAEEIHGKRYLLEARYAAWKELFLYVKQFMRKDESNEMKEILNEMGSVFEAESYLQKKFDLNVSYLEKRMIAVVRTGTKYAATMEEMYRIGLEAVCVASKSHNYCGNNRTVVTCGKTFAGEGLSDIITEFDSDTSGHIDLRFHNGTVQSNGGNKLADRIDMASTTFGRILKHQGIKSSLRVHAETNDYGLVEKVNAIKLLRFFVTPLREINEITSKIEAIPSKLSERAFRIDTLSGKLQSLLSSITAPTTQD
ncbi:hypothetical protein, conserved [Trypanosoma brucei gambiense DAL972]|uniref:Uncharacterized protein n=1 Tax=Trypanosoma brucei gambiense (strain MHOM/CI/86/DAL972) TaxID=679716 RepID=C9ZMX3_TRYB9|nr:hypothetical protein, conserved [Trypanosoma brucei gambiense DAL972]CBH10626.1 hypothetical protein, conserved [Trypanosoma brucei gambiense DAL972]|eukprot:XP_011772915.1 hypothetical protein, conserved [Trypanosoma brucei gambiense DAL972]